MATRQITRKDAEAKDSQITLADRNRIDSDNGVYGSNNLKYEVNRSGNAQEFYQPVNGGVKIIDITKDAKISLNPDSVYDDVPCIRLREYSPKYGAGIQNLFSIANTIADAIDQYDTEGFSFSLDSSFGAVRKFGRPKCLAL